MGERAGGRAGERARGAVDADDADGDDGRDARVHESRAGGGETAIDGRSDQYSLACVLWEMLAGEMPFSGATASVILARRFAETPPPLRRVRSDVPEGVERAVAKALSRRPEDRFAGAEAFGNELRDGDGSGRRGAAAPASLLVALPLGVMVGARPAARLDAFARARRSGGR